jgi:hypothetical protein
MVIPAVPASSQRAAGRLSREGKPGGTVQAHDTHGKRSRASSRKPPRQWHDFHEQWAIGPTPQRHQHTTWRGGIGPA